MRKLKHYLKQINYKLFGLNIKSRIRIQSKYFCSRFTNVMYQKEKILGYNLIPEEIYNQIISKDVNLSQDLIKEEILLNYSRYKNYDFIEEEDINNYLFLKPNVKNFIINSYKIHPIFFSRNFIIKFIEELLENKHFNDYLEDWILKPKEEKISIISSETIKFNELSKEDYLFYKPVIDLFVEYITNNFSKEIHIINFLSTLTQNLINPHLWFPEARLIKRKIFVHIGKPNSGKTTFTLKLLENAEKGIFLTNNKHLSYEIYETLKNTKKCDFFSEECHYLDKESTHSSCIIGMCDLSKSYKLAVIDEFHLISDKINGFTYTNAILGLNCEEIHICIEEFQKNLIKKLCSITGDEIEIINHYRKSDIEFDREIVQSVSRLKIGDCIVAKNFEEMIEIKKKINKKFQKNHTRKINKCALLYCNLPLSIHFFQKNNFNNRHSSASYLITTYETIKTGINLNITRVVFSKIKTYPVCEDSVKMVAGRSGNNKENGMISAFRQTDLDFLKYILMKKSREQKEVDVEKRACLFPPLKILKEFMRIIKSYENKKCITISDLLLKFEAISKLDQQYIFRTFVIKELQCLPIENEDEIDLLYHIITCPIKITDKLANQLCNFYFQYKKFNIIRLPSDFNLENKSLFYFKYSDENLFNFEEINSILSAYIYLSKPFPDCFVEKDLAIVIQNRICNIIESILANKYYNPYLDMKNEETSEKSFENSSINKDFDN